MELENIVANTVLLKAREGKSAGPAPMPLSACDGGAEQDDSAESPPGEELLSRRTRSADDVHAFNVHAWSSRR